MPLLYLALAAGAYWLWSSEGGGSSGCALDPGTSDAVRHQVEAFLSESHDAAEHDAAAGMLDAGGYPMAASCIRAARPDALPLMTFSANHFR